jgi:hypothetical protein
MKRNYPKYAASYLLAWSDKLLDVLVPQVACDKHEQASVYEYTPDETIVMGLWDYTRADANEEEIRLALIRVEGVERIASRVTVRSGYDYLV